MQKIGLSVCYDTKNFGSQLQVLATDYKVKELGYETEIIRYKKKLSPVFLLQSLPRFFNPFFIKGKLTGRKKRREIAKHPEIAKEVKKRNQYFDNFVKTHFTNLSKPYVGWEALKRDSAGAYDAFLCGSDQLWLPSNLGSHFYTLEFAPDDKAKIAYATSFGVSRIPWFQKRRTAKYLNRFAALSTRELAGGRIIEDLTGKKPEVVCDPTLLLTREEWADVIPENRKVKEPYVFCYFLGTNIEHREAAKTFAEKTGLKIVTCPFLDHFVEADMSFGDERLYEVDAADFVNLIRNAEYILTDSFHGSVFSILHHKKFVTFNRFGNGANSRNSRIDSLCKLLGLESRRFAGDIYANAVNEIDYSQVDVKLTKLRTKSENYLRDALKNI